MVNMQPLRLHSRFARPLMAPARSRPAGRPRRGSRGRGGHRPSAWRSRTRGGRRRSGTTGS
jgi:hypothetical protein